MKVLKGSAVNSVASGSLSVLFDKAIFTGQHVALHYNDTHICGVYQPLLNEFLAQCESEGIKVIDKRAAA